MIVVDFVIQSVISDYKTQSNVVRESELGKKIKYDQAYNPGRLYPIARAAKRQEIGINPADLPFFGFDCWNHYEVSWLNPKGKPMVAIAEIYYHCQSPFMVESKSLKLYFNSLNHSRFATITAVERTIKKDLEKIVDADVTVIIKSLDQCSPIPLHINFNGECIDNLDVTCTTYTVDPSTLSTTNEQTEEILCSNLLKSNCLVTHQPDWASIQISYSGNKINHAGLLQYLVSYRNHYEFHEQCIERIFIDIMKHCHPSALTIYGRYTRRGGIDINPYRSTKPVNFNQMNFRLLRQ